MEMTNFLLGCASQINSADWNMKPNGVLGLGFSNSGAPSVLDQVFSNEGSGLSGLGLSMFSLCFGSDGGIYSFGKGHNESIPKVNLVQPKNGESYFCANLQNISVCFFLYFAFSDYFGT